MRRLIVLCLLLWSALMGALASSDLAAAERVDLPGAQAPLIGHISYWRDPTGSVSVDEVASKPAADFTLLQNKLSLGFTADVVWLRLTLDGGAAGTTPSEQWLELAQSVLMDARLFAPTGDGGYGRVGVGAHGDSQARQMAHRLPLFALPVDTTPQTYLLRLASDTSMSMSLKLWEPRAFMKASPSEGFIWGWVFGAYMLTVLFYFFFWLWTREPIHLLYTGYVGVNCMAALFSGGWLSLFAPEVSDAVWLKALGLWISLSVWVGLLFTVRFLHMDDRWPGLSRWVTALVAFICLVVLVGVMAGHYRDVIPPMQLISVVTIVLTLILGVQLARQGYREARFFLFAFSFFYVGVTWRYLRNFGVLEPSFWNDNSYQIGAFIHMLVMSTGIFAGYNRLRRDKQIAEARAAMEARLREEQRDFVSMVSHELRNPLSIIGASADNMTQDPGLSDKSRQRVNKIIRSSERMTQLMENYLSKERMLLDSEHIKPAPVDLLALSRQVLDDLEDSRSATVEVRASHAQLQARCDAGLIKIALQNLVNNALRHSPPGARVLVSLETRLHSAEIRVRDEGNGIPHDEIAHIFSRFYRGRGALDQPGAGLGLYLVRTIAERHGGWVTVQNLPGRGCEFRVQWPQ